MILLHPSLPRAGVRATRLEMPSLEMAARDASAGRPRISGAAIVRFLHVRGIAGAAIDRRLQRRGTSGTAIDRFLHVPGIAGAAIDRRLQGRGTSGTAIDRFLHVRSIAGAAIDRRLQGRGTSGAARGPIFQKTSASVTASIRPFGIRHFPAPFLPAASRLHPQLPDS